MRMQGKGNQSKGRKRGRASDIRRAMSNNV